jgi:hypothetical protein
MATAYTSFTIYLKKALLKELWGGYIKDRTEGFDDYFP